MAEEAERLTRIVGAVRRGALEAYSLSSLVHIAATWAVAEREWAIDTVNTLASCKLNQEAAKKAMTAAHDELIACAKELFSRGGFDAVATHLRDGDLLVVFALLMRDADREYHMSEITADNCTICLSGRSVGPMPDPDALGERCWKAWENWGVAATHQTFADKMLYEAIERAIHEKMLEIGDEGT